MRLNTLAERVERLRPRSVVVLAKTSEGETRTMDVDELIRTSSDFIRCVDGNSRRDVVRILDYLAPDSVID